MVKREFVWAISLVMVRILKFCEYCLILLKQLLVYVVFLKRDFIKSIHVQIQRKTTMMPQQKIDLKAFIHNVEKRQTYFKNHVVFSPQDFKVCLAIFQHSELKG